MATKKTKQEVDKTDHVRLVVENDMVKDTVIELEKRFIAETARLSNKPVVLDLTKVHRIDSRGITLCIGLFKECKAKGCEFSILASAELSRFFRVLKLTKVIDIREETTV